MSVLDIILVVLLVIGVAGIVVLILRKIPIMRVTNPAQLKKLEQQAVKQQLSEARVRRKLGQFGRSTASATVELWRRLRSTPKEKDDEEETTFTERLEQELKSRTSRKQTVAELMTEAAQAVVDADANKAEGAYLKAIELDPHNLEAYQGLGEVYLEKRDYESAREVYEYLAQRGSEVASTLGLARVASGQGKLEEAKGAFLKSLGITTAIQPRLELVRILRELGHITEALGHLAEARKLEPNNPKILDLFVELSILSGRPNEAQGALDQLREVNPENQKIAGMAMEVRRLRDKLKPKRKRPHSHSETFGLPR